MIRKGDGHWLVGGGSWQRVWLMMWERWELVSWMVLQRIAATKGEAGTGGGGRIAKGWP